MADINDVESWETNPDDNANISGVPLGEGETFPSHVNNAIRALMAQLATFFNGFMGGEIHAAPSKLLPVAADEFGYWDSVSGLLRKIPYSNLLSPWAAQPIGVPIAVWDHVAGLAPPTDQAYRFVKLTAADAYNTGFLTSESVSGSAPAVQATAVVNSVGSLLHGATIRLINTERRFLRAGSSGTVEADTFLNHPHTGSFAGDAVPPHSHTANWFSFNGNDVGGGATTPRSTTTANTSSAGGHTPSGTVTINASTAGGTETRGKNVGVTYYMRIK